MPATEHSLLHQRGFDLVAKIGAGGPALAKAAETRLAATKFAAIRFAKAGFAKARLQKQSWQKAKSAKAVSTKSQCQTEAGALRHRLRYRKYNR
jgi:hypothetical protein